MTATLSPLIDVTDLQLTPEDLWRAEDFAPKSGRGRRWHRLPRPEVALLTVVALVGYCWVAYYLRNDLHFFINDAINRTTDGVYVSVSRDPHFMGIGFYWPPLAQMIQVPFVVILNPFGQMAMAGPLSSAFCMALTIPVLARIARDVGLGRPTTLLVLVTFAVNPVVIYYAANGMSESCFFLAGAVTLLGFFRYIKDRTVPNIILFSLGMSAVAMTRLEGPAMDVALTAIATFNLRNLKRSLWDAFVLGAPPLVIFGYWIAVQWILLGDPLFFRHQQGGGAPPGKGHAPWLPNTAADPFSAVPWAFHWVYVLGPALILVAAAGIITPQRKRLRGTIGVLASMGVFLAIQIDQVIKGAGFGDPRYFVMTILFATVGVIWVSARSTRRFSPLPALWNIPLIGVLLVSGGTGSWELTSARLTTPEHECIFFEDAVAKELPILGREPVAKTTCPVPFDGLAAWKSTALWLDAHMTASDRVLTDNSEVPFPDLYSHKSDQYVVQNDADWHKTVSNPYFVTYIITESTSKGGVPNTAEGDQGALLIAQAPTVWKLVHGDGPAYDINHGTVWPEVYHYVGPPRTQATFSQ